jgi:hypothetical protein
LIIGHSIHQFASDPQCDLENRPRWMLRVGSEPRR